MKILLAGVVAMTTILTGCAGNSDVTPEQTSVAISELAPVQIDHQPSGESVETLYCGPYAGPGTAKLRVVRPFKSENVGCPLYVALVTKFLDMEASRTGSGRALVEGWECSAFGAVQSSRLGSAVICQYDGVTVYLDLEEPLGDEPGYP